MGLSVTATYGIIFTASLMMFGVLLGSMLYAYDQFNSGIRNRIEIVNNHQNMIRVERVVFNASRVEIFARNEGSATVNMEKTTVLINGTPVEFSTEDYWYPGEEVRIFANSTYDIGDEHSVQFTISPGANFIATSEYDKVYALNSSGLIAYDYSGVVRWFRSVAGPRDVSVGDDVFVLNNTGIIVYDYSGTQISFLHRPGLSSLDSRGSTIYAISKTRLFIINSSSGATESVGIGDGRDVTVGDRVYVLNGSAVDIYDFSGNFLGRISDPRLSYATRISTDRNMAGDYLFVLTSLGNILVYRGGEFIGSIPVPVDAGNLDIYGKIYLAGAGVIGMDIGYRVKIVDQYGNEAYGFL